MDRNSFTFTCCSGMEASSFSSVQHSRIHTSCPFLKMETFPVSEKLFLIQTMKKAPKFGQFLTTYHRTLQLLYRNITLTSVIPFSCLLHFQTCLSYSHQKGFLKYGPPSFLRIRRSLIPNRRAIQELMTPLAGQPKSGEAYGVGFVSRRH
jgi:hypothetical protein